MPNEMQADTAPATAPEVQADEDDLRLWYRQPASGWSEALPIGNGTLGAMVFGGVERDRLQLNIDTLWSGYPNDAQPRPGAEVLAEIRRLVIQEQRYVEAGELAKQFQGAFTESYLPLADIFLEVEHSAAASDYRRELDLATAVARLDYAVDGTRFSREVFASAPHKAIVMRLACDSADGLTCRLHIESPLQSTVDVGESGMLVVRGKAPAHVVAHHLESDHPIVYEDTEGRGMRFEARVLALVEGGRVTADHDAIRIGGATAVTLLIAAATGYRGFGQMPDRPAAEISQDVERSLAEAAAVPYDRLRMAHVNDYRSLFARLDLKLGRNSAAHLPTDERLRAPDLTRDAQVAALYLQYGRYLLIASSRPGTQPANLQGLWNDQVRPIWGSDYTININLQMNYWHAESANLAECHQPLLDFIGELSVAGRAAAGQTYNCRGWAAHNGSDLWRSARSGGGGFSTPDWSMWPMGGVWLCRHLWEHFEFGRDRAFLSGYAFPIMKAAAEFCLDWLIEDGPGHLVTCPSTSPENQFVTAAGEPAAVSMASTMDLMLIWDLFTNCVEACAVLGIDDAFLSEIQTARERLLPLQVGRHGQLQEWSVDFEETEPGHRHLSHLYGLHPGRQISGRDTPALAQAARRSLDRRLAFGGGQTGWSRAWMIGLWSRLGDGDRAHAQLQALLRDATLSNLLNTHPPFQIDGNFGGAAGILEMLLQSQAGVLELLPALPGAWSDGAVRGLRARGGFTVDIAWDQGTLRHAAVVSDDDAPCRVLYAPRTLSLVEGPDGANVANGADQVLEFQARRGRRAIIVPVD